MALVHHQSLYYRDQAKTSPGRSDPFSHLAPPTLPSSSGSSPSRTYKLKTKWSPPIERPASSFLPHHLSSGHPYDLYDVPRPSPVPSPSMFKRPNQSSNSAYSSLHSVSNTASENEYDIPRSLTDLRRVDSPYSVRVHSTEHMTGGSRTSSSSEHINQLAMLKDEYPDYDFPRPSGSIDDPDYDVPRSVKSFGTVDSRSEGNISFGALDKMMADIDSQVAGTIESNTDNDQDQEPVIVNNGTSQEIDTKSEKIEDATEHQAEPQNVINQESAPDKQAGFVTNVVPPPKPATQEKITQQDTIDESILANRILRPLLRQPASFPQISPDQLPREAAYDRLSARLALEQLKKDGIVPRDAQEQKKWTPEEETVQKENKSSEKVNISLPLPATTPTEQPKV